MEQVRVVILSGNSLFAEGVANRLEQYPAQVDVRIINPQNHDLVAQIAAQKPAVLMLDANDLETIQLCPLSQLLFTFPTLRVVQLDSQKEKTQVISIEQHQAVDAADLLRVMVATSGLAHGLASANLAANEAHNPTLLH